jgi:hypothetical protein
MLTTYYGGDKMVKRKLVMTVGTFRKGSKTDMKPGYSISYRVEKASKNSKLFKVVSTLKPKKTNVQKQKEKGRKKFAKRKFTTGNERVQNARRRGKAPSQRKYKR